MKKAPLSVARRYARALFDVAAQQKSTDAQEPRLRAAAELLEQNAELRRALLHPALVADKKKKLASAAWGGGDPLFSRFSDLLIERGRVELLPAVHAAYVELWNESRGVVAAEAVSAVPLVPTQEQALAAAAKKLAGREVRLTASVDPALVGGVVLRMNGRTYDGSVRTRLRTLRQRLAQGVTSSSSTTR